MEPVQFTTKSGENNCESSDSSLIESNYFDIVNLLDSKHCLVESSKFYVLVNYNGSIIVCLCDVNCRFLEFSLFLYDNYKIDYDFVFESPLETYYAFSKAHIQIQLTNFTQVKLRKCGFLRLYRTVFLEEYRIESYTNSIKKSFLTDYLSQIEERVHVRNMYVQSQDFHIYMDLFSKLLLRKYPHLANLTEADFNVIAQHIDNIRELSLQLVLSKNMFDVWHAIGLYLRLCNKTNVVFDLPAHFEMLTSFFQTIFGKVFSMDIFSDTQVQSSFPVGVDTFLNLLGKLKDNFGEVRNCPLWTKFHKAMMFLMSKSYFDCLGLTLDKFGYDRFEKAAEKKKHELSGDFFECMLDTSHFVLTNLWSCVQTGSFSSLLHGKSTYLDYITDCDTIKRQVLWLNEPEEHGFSESSFFELLESVASRGDDILKHCKSQLSKIELDKILKQVCEIKMIHCEQFSLRRAREHRSSPFAVLLSGSSSVGKTTLVEILFKTHASLFNLPNEAQYKYTKNPVAKYWDGFKTYMWCILMDDIAFMHPNSASQGDPTLMEIIQVVNNCPHVPDQAALDDKGRTPNRAKQVIATTNTIHLNAHAYYSCPLAARRRLPHIVDIKVKEEFSSMGMLDSSLATLDENNMPNWWIFNIKKIVCTDPNGVDVRLESDQVITDIYEFLAWYRDRAMTHEKIQKAVMQNNKVFDTISFCETCKNIKFRCTCLTQSSMFVKVCEITLYAFISCVINWLMQTFGSMLMQRYFKYKFDNYTSSLKNRLLGYRKKVTSPFYPRVVTTVVEDQLERLDVEHAYWKKLFSKIGSKVAEPVMQHSWIAGAIAILGISTVTYPLIRKLFKMNSLKPQGQIQDILASGSKPVAAKDEPLNFWVNADRYELTTKAMTREILSTNGLSSEEFINIVYNNTGHATFSSDEFPNQFMQGNILWLSGHWACINKHIIEPYKNSEFIHIEIVQGVKNIGVNSNVTLNLKYSDFSVVDNDTVLFQIPNLPAKRDLLKFIPQEEFKSSHNGVMVNRSRCNSRKLVRVQGLSHYNFYHFNLGNLNTLKGKTSEPTLDGDCGSPYFIKTDLGYCLVGIHVIYSPDSQEILCNRFNKPKIISIITSNPLDISVQCSFPQTDKPFSDKELGDLHFKSPLRFIEEGSANVFGSYNGFRPKGQSKVGRTLISETVQKMFDYQVKHGPPVMSGYKPWRTGALEMVKSDCNVDIKILDQVTEEFASESIKEMRKNPKKPMSFVEVYDHMTTINGRPGVAYVDKMKRNTSAGEPYRKSKTHYMNYLDPNEDYMDAVDLSPEIMERVEEVIRQYIQGFRACPKFMACLKDEAIKFAKIEIGKTRIFCASPIEWTYVVRKYMLCICRVMQNCKYIFNSAPGMVCQSSEWEVLYHYLTFFGRDRMVAGDFQAFDKSMQAIFIKKAFDFLKRIFAAGGYTEEQIRIICGIQEDTAFPFVEFNGDLIEFFGTLPSGHPLTVIINCIVNVLYMRYVFCLCSPDQSSLKFTYLVHLMTYGDDNIMGISQECSWFDHTIIQTELAKIGVVYTMADKESESVPFIDIDQTSFLKRTFRYDSEVDAILCPLEEDSILKSLTIGLRSKSITPQQHAVEVMSSACREYFYYGKDIFNQMRSRFEQIVQIHDLSYFVQDSSFPSWEELNQEFKNNNLKREARVLLMREGKFTNWSIC